MNRWIKKWTGSRLYEIKRNWITKHVAKQIQLRRKNPFYNYDSPEIFVKKVRKLLSKAKTNL